MAHLNAEGTVSMELLQQADHPPFEGECMIVVNQIRLRTAAGQMLWQPVEYEVNLIRSAWSDDFDFLYELGVDIYTFIFEAAPETHHLFPELVAAGAAWRETGAFRKQALKLVQVNNNYM